MKTRPPKVRDKTGRYRQPPGRGPNGRKLCRWCHEEVPPGRRTWCSQECVDSYLLSTDWSHARNFVGKRDRHRCQMCGLDCALTRRLSAVMRLHFPEVMKEFRAHLISIGFDSRHAFGYQELWEVDHITPRHRGGSHEPENLRTLCSACHKSVTAQQARDRAAQRKAKR